MRKIRRDDEVIVLTGRDRAKRGQVRKVLPDGRALVTGLNMVKRHVKPNPNINRTGGIEEREAPIHLSNLALVNPETQKAEPSKVVWQTPEGAAKPVKARVYKRSGKTV